ncbi:MAG: nucleotidyl transferase AbiEii/AbiGii toxin family protein [Anaerolineae bacterium]|nr:nucleotidyl transferase AbiEii/AbiGii toxin family protein [Anaerolineae bacterium]
MLGFTTNTTEHLSVVVRDICQASVVDDGVVFPAESVTAEVIRQRAEYVGVRVQFVAHSGKSVVPMQIDVGFADAITPAPEMIEYPVMLDFPAPRIRAYPRETTIAEKFHAMADLGFDNTRMKDFYDLWQMLWLFTFDGDRLAGAIHATFERRGREALLEEPVAFAEAFIISTAKETQWKAFVRKNRLNDAPTWSVAVRAIRDWLTPILEPARTQQPFNFTWHPESGWR